MFSNLATTHVTSRLIEPRARSVITTPPHASYRARYFENIATAPEAAIGIKSHQT